MRFQLLIPTYNRGEILRKNLLNLLEQIKTHGLATDIGLVVSDNASPDNTYTYLNELAPEFAKAGIEFLFSRNEVNTGLEANVVHMLANATAEYLIWLGDDDFLPEGFLPYAVDRFKKEPIGWMLTGALSDTGEGEMHDMYRLGYDEKHFDAGYDAIWSVSNYGHKMSGLVVKREGLLESYTAHPQWRNLYLFIYFLAYNQERYPGIFAHKYKVVVNNYNKKDFSYNSIGLLDEVFKSYNYFIADFGMKKAMKLVLRFVVMHSYRIQFRKGLPFLLKQWRTIYGSYEFGRNLKWGLLRLLLKEYTKQNIYLPLAGIFRKKGK